MSIFKNLASRRGDDKAGTDGGSASAKLLSLRDHAKAAPPAPPPWMEAPAAEPSRLAEAAPAAAAPAATLPPAAPVAPMAPVAPAFAPAAEASNVRSMWDLVVEDDEAAEPAPAAFAPPSGHDAFAPADEQADSPARRAGRVRTRLLGFDHSGGTGEEAARGAAAADTVKFPVGWLVVVDGPGRGAAFALSHGVSQIGRGEDQAVALDFGDTAISREGHAMIAYDDESRGFFIGHGGKSNIVRLNGKPVLSTEPAKGGDLIRMGETTLMLVALCGTGFTWAET